MNVLKLFVIFALCLTIPAPVAAQIVIDRYNEDSDPSQPVKKAEPKKEASTAEVEEEPDTELTDEEIEDIKTALVKHLGKTHTACVSKSKLFRSDLATVDGSTSWTVDADGNVSPDGETTLTTESKEAFFATDKAMKQLPPERSDLIMKSAMGSYNECAAPTAIKVPVEGKLGSIQLTYSVTFKGKKAKITVQD